MRPGRAPGGLLVVTLGCGAMAGACDLVDRAVGLRARAVASAAPPPSAAPSAAAAAAGPRAGAAVPSSGLRPLPPLEGYRPVKVGGVSYGKEGNVVLLVDVAANVAVPIFVGPTEALSIELRLDGRRYRRPLTHDLFDATVSRLGGRVERVTIDRLEDDTFHATVVIRDGEERFALDARSSDAIALALGSRAPIQVAESVVRRAGVDLGRLQSLADDAEEAPANPEPAPERPLHL